MEKHHSKITRQQSVTWKSELFVLIEDDMACFNENNASNPLGIF